MKISLNWLTDYVDVSMLAEKLADLLTHTGFNCEEIIETSSDIIFDLEVPSNRPDCLGHLGMAREVAAATGGEFRPPVISEIPVRGKIDELAEVVVEAPDLCPRYTARVIRGVKIGPSPDWLIERIEGAGLRSVNNVVDVTNYVLMEYSQPLHSFDYDKLSGGKIVVRRALEGETLESIDETLCKLDPSMLVIADAEKAVAIAGVMGGLNTEVTESTVNLLIESAQFDPLTTRHTSRKLALMSESNYRFERGVDVVALELASLRACEMIVDLAGGELAEGLVDVWAEPFSPRTVSLRPERCNGLLGIDIAPETQWDILNRLGLSPRPEAGKIVCDIPSYRNDLQRESDLIEEVARMEGYEKIPISDHVSHSVTDEGQDQKTRQRMGMLLTAGGFDEAITHTFIDLKETALFGYDEAVCVDKAVRKTNNALRPTLFPSLLRTCKTNQDAGNTSVSLFELASVFPVGNGNRKLPDEHVELAMITTDDLRDLRGTIEMLVRRLTPAVELDIRSANVAGFADGQAAEIVLSGQTVGTLGYVAPDIHDYYSLERRIAAARLKFSALVENSQYQKTYEPVAKFPAIDRDLSLVVDQDITWRQLEDAISAVDQPMRVAMQYVTTYRGKQIPAGRKSVTVRMLYRSQSETLRSEQVDQQVGQIVAALQEKFSAELRT